MAMIAMAAALAACACGLTSCMTARHEPVPRSEVDIISSVVMDGTPTVSIALGADGEALGADEAVENDAAPDAEGDGAAQGAGAVEDGDDAAGDGAGASYATAAISVRFRNPSDMPVAALNDVSVELLDATGQPVAVHRETVLEKLDAHDSARFKYTFALGEDEFNAVERLRVSHICPTGHSLSSGCAYGLQGIPGMKRELLAAAEHQATQDRIIAWKEKYSTTDYSDTILIGDSLMDNARSALKSQLPGATIDADSGRTLENGGVIREFESPDHGVLDHIRRDNGSYERYVIGTGNNNVGGVKLANAQEIVDCIGPDKQIYFISMCVTGNKGGTATTNESIDAMVEQYPNVHKIDWYGLVHGHESEFLADGCHPRKDHIPQYVTCIKEGLDTVY